MLPKRPEKRKRTPSPESQERPDKRARTKSQQDQLELMIDKGRISFVHPADKEEFHQFIDETLYPQRTHNLQQPLYKLTDQVVTKNLLPLMEDNQNDILNASLASKHLHRLFTPHCQAKKLLRMVVCGDKKTAERVIANNPHLLLIKAKTTDDAGRHIQGTTLQAALGSGNIRYGKDEECMTEMILRYMNQLPDAKATIRGQMIEQFPPGWEKKEEERKARDTKAVKTVMQAIRQAESIDQCREAIQAFRNYIDQENKGRIFRSGMHFNTQIYLDAFKEIETIPSNKMSFAVIMVAGYIERYKTACFARATAQGITNITISGEHTSYPEFYNSHYHFPLDSKAEKRLGYHFSTFDANRWGLTKGADGIRPFEAFTVRSTRNLLHLFQQYNIPNDTHIKERDIDTMHEEGIRSKMIRIFGRK